MFVRGANPKDKIQKFIQKVTYGLDPTFGTTEVTVKAAPYEMTRIGWGTFDVPITIHFRK